MIRALTLCACLVMALPLSAQKKHRKVKANTPKVTTTVATDSIRHHLALYRLDDVRKDISTLERGGESARNDAAIYTARLEKIERLLPHTEALLLVAKYKTSWTELPNLLRELSPLLAKSIQIDSEVPTTYVYDVRLGQMHFALKRDEGLKALCRTDYPVGEQPYTSSLGEVINTADGYENFPILLSDGIRLLFARKAEEGLGGYDLYLSRYSVDKSEYLEPTMLGLPFNSPDNDYLLAYDEEQDKTFLISDRHCAPTELMLYVFRGLPEVLREKTDIDKTPIAEREEQIKHALLQQDLTNESNQ